MPTSAGIPDARVSCPPLPVRVLLLLCALVAGGPAGAAGDGLFIGQFAVEDARVAPQTRQTLHYRIRHDEPDLLEAQLAGWLGATQRSGDGIAFSLDGYPVTATPAADAGHLAASFLIDYTEPPVQALREQIESRYGAYPSPAGLEEFVYEHIADKNAAHGFDVASVVARSRSGDCTEHAVLLTALLRMYGYPARTVIGVYVSLQEPLLGYGHAWTEYRGVAGWTGVDATRIDDGVGAQHIPLGVIRDEGIGYRMAVAGALRYLSITGIRVE